MEVVFTEAKKPEAPPPRNYQPPIVRERAAETQREEPVAPAATPTSEEIKKRTRDTYGSMGWGEPPEEPAPPVRLPNDPGPTKTAEEIAAEEAAAAEAARVAAEQQEEEVHEPTTADIISQTAQATATAVAREIGPRETRPVPQPEPPPGIDLSTEDAADLAIIRYLEHEEPARFRGATQRYLDYVQAHYNYQSEWLKANAGKEFDPDAEEHAQWYADNDPGITRDEIDQGRIQKLAEEVADRKYGTKLREIEQNEKLSRALPQIAVTQTARVHEMVTMVNPDLAKLVTGADGRPNLTEATAAAVYEADPIAAPIIDSIAANELNPMIEELGKVDAEGLNYKFDASRNPVHRQIANFILQKEKEMARAPRSVQVVNGAQWIPLSEYNRRVQEINSMATNDFDRRGRIDQLNRSFWALSTEMTATLITDYCAQKAKRLIDEEDKRAKKKYGGTATAPAAPAATPAARPAAAPQNPNGKPRSPSLGGQPEVSTVRNPSGAGAKSYGETAVDVNFAR